MFKLIDKAFLILLCLGLLIMPFVFWPWAKIAYEIPRVVFVKYWLEIVILCGILFIYRKKNNNKPDKRLIYPVLLLGLTAILSSLLGQDIYKSYFGNYFRGDGLLTLFHLIGLFLILSFYWKKNWFMSVAGSISLASFLTSLWSGYLGIRLYWFDDKTVSNWQGAIGGFFGQPNFLTGYLLVTMSFYLYFYLKTKRKAVKWLVITAMVIQSIAIILTRAWIGIIGLVFFGLLTVLTISKNKTVKITTVLVTFLTVLTVFFFYAQSVNKQGYVAESRQRIYTKVLMAGLKRPIFGWGWANVDYAFDSVDYPIKYSNDVYVDKAHSEFLEILATTGIIGLIIYSSLWLIFLKKLFVLFNKDRIIGGVLITTAIMYLFHSQTNIMSIAEEIIFWIVLGITASG